MLNFCSLFTYDTSPIVEAQIIHPHTLVMEINAEVYGLLWEFVKTSDRKLINFVFIPVKARRDESSFSFSLFHEYTKK